MSLQKTFDFIVDALVKQGAPSAVLNASGQPLGCKYRAESNTGKRLKCAVGHLIPDWLYEPRFDNVSGGTPYDQLPEKVKAHLRAPAGNPPGFDDFVSQMQRAHDNAATAPDGSGYWVYDFLVMAKQIGQHRSYNLNTDNVDKHFSAIHASRGARNAE